MPQFRPFGEQMFVSRVAFLSPNVFRAKSANDSDELGYGLLVIADQWSMCWSLCPYESVKPNACSWRSLVKVKFILVLQMIIKRWETHQEVGEDMPLEGSRTAEISISRSISRDVTRHLSEGKKAIE